MEKQKNTVKIAKMGMLVAISVVLVSLIHVSLVPSVAFLEYDPADIPILLGTFAFGPLSGVVLTVVTSVIQGVTVSAHSGVYGIIMHIIATSVLCLVSGIVYNYGKKKTKKHAIIGLILGTAAMVVTMIGANMLITPIFMGVPAGVVWSLMPGIMLFNFLKGGINSVVTFLVYKRVSAFLHK
ncbi:MAG: ECF transporter S component [Clostridia bacterium]|nr:ECF transporter S component [Clostridia bacterium]